MNTQKKSQATPRREAFRCSGRQLDAIVRFAQERKMDDQPLYLVVAEYSRYQAKAA